MGGIRSPTKASHCCQANWYRNYSSSLADAVHEGRKEQGKMPCEFGPMSVVFGLPRERYPTFKYPRLINPLPSFPDSVVDPSMAADKNLPLLRHQPLFRTALQVRDNIDTCLFKRWLCILADNWDGSEAGRWIKQLRPPEQMSSHDFGGQGEIHLGEAG